MAKFVLVINCGSSSLKYALIDAESGESPLSGLAERLGQGGQGNFKAKFNGQKRDLVLEPATHEEAMRVLVDLISELGLTDSVRAVGHRIVHGGEYFAESVLIDDGVRDKILECAKLAPLHNPAHVVGIDAARKCFGHLSQVAVFDTAFHQKMPEKAFLYALPKEFYKDYHLRRYGFHGTSYRYIASQLPTLLAKEKPKAVVCHLGNGGSLAAIDGDHSVDTTMGVTPLEGIVHGTRTGDIDPAIPCLLISQFGYSADEVNDILWKKSGLLGISGISNDCRSLEEEMEKGNQDAILAMEIYCYRLAKNIAAQMVALGGCDALVFTGGIGENSEFVRARCVAQLAFLGFSLDEEKNKSVLFGKTGIISQEGSKAVWVVPTNEELMIARDTMALAE